ncbi:hypothetical protein ENBRE01_1053 [Enteropsectra breve]|nr:hypothetical protein ENBRE01_1053 [Enteropsectra breve]
MEQTKEMIAEMLGRVESLNLKEIAARTVSENKKYENEFREYKETISENIKIIQRKNSQIESEVQQLEIALSKNNERYNKKNNDRLKLAKKVIEYEQKNEEIENKINELERAIAMKENEIQKIKGPSAEMLYYEIVRGFNVEFSRTKGKVVAKIKNKEKNDVFVVDTSEGSAGDICNKIWECME